MFFKPDFNHFGCYSLKIRKTLKITAEKLELEELKSKTKIQNYVKNKTQNGIRKNPKSLLIVKSFSVFGLLRTDCKTKKFRLP